MSKLVGTVLVLLWMVMCLLLAAWSVFPSGSAQERVAGALSVLFGCLILVVGCAAIIRGIWS
jgi:hypothetical protein